MNERTPSPPSRRKMQAREITAAVLGGLAVLFAVLNLDEVDVHWIVATWRTPLILVILVCLAIGAVLGWIAARRRSG